MGVLGEICLKHRAFFRQDYKVFKINRILIILQSCLKKSGLYKSVLNKKRSKRHNQRLTISYHPFMFFFHQY